MQVPPLEKAVDQRKKGKGLFFLWLLDNMRVLSSSELSCKGHAARQYTVIYSHCSKHSPNPKIQLSSLQ